MTEEQIAGLFRDTAELFDELIPYLPAEPQREFVEHLRTFRDRIREAFPAS
jgi:hypothetical protein